MNLTSYQIHQTIIHGAYLVIRNKETLNKINVFPIADGDTGSNLASMMRSIIFNSQVMDTVKQTMKSISNAALIGARGNSGIIFAQYFNGLSESIKDEKFISIQDYAEASNIAVAYAYSAIENPVEGTIITVMTEWSKALLEISGKKKSVEKVFNYAFERLRVSLENTKFQLEVLKKANVVDSGAKGFVYFIEGGLTYIEKGGEQEIQEAISEEIECIQESYQDLLDVSSKYRYCTECLLVSDKIDINEIKIFLRGKGDSLVIAGNEQKCRIHIHTNDIAEVIEFLFTKGDIVYQKIDDMKKQEAILKNQKSKIALVTDSIADLPQNIIDEEQIHVVNLNILFQDRTYIDKLTIFPSKLLELAASSQELPTSSQANPKQIENLFDYLSTYYDSVIALTVSKELSGTYESFKTASKNVKEDFKISVLNTKQNSIAQGLLVKRCAELIDRGLSHDMIMTNMLKQVEESKIIVQVKTLDSMIKSGRLNSKIGYIGKKIGMKPIVTLDRNGKAALDGIAFSMKASNKKIIKHIKKVIKKHSIIQYSISHVCNESGARKLLDDIESLIGFKPEYIEETSSIVAVSAGEGAVAFAYLLEKRV